ncbi:MAG: RluA family pseudouridine synthase [Saprospiraceae bacterium]|nr:RluA family pseudouridine synthase [Saprospiraceae bacterium]
MTSKLTRWTHTVPATSGKIRIDDYCGPVFSILGSKSATKKAIKSNRLFLNGRPAKTADFVRKGDTIAVIGAGVRNIKRINIPLEIVFEDHHLIIINKPGGIAVNGNRHKTVENALVGVAKPSLVNDALPRPVAVHRIDVPTNGLVMLAKTKSALIKMTNAFQDRKVDKMYHAIVHGRPEREFRINESIENKEATTIGSTISTVPSLKYEHLSLVHLKPFTGRTHQLRIHMQSIGHLIVGDKLYAQGQHTILGKGLLLCAASLHFSHPNHGSDVAVTIETPRKFNRILDREASRFESQKD